MICYKDMTFCSAHCKNLNCRRNYTEEVSLGAKEWWEGFNIEGLPPVAFSDFSPVCNSYDPEDE